MAPSRGDDGQVEPAGDWGAIWRAVKGLHLSRMMDEQNAEKDPRVYFAAERTFLAWIRTGLGLMGVGFAVARFGLFLREMRAAETHVVVRSGGFSVWTGVAIVFLGVIVLVSATAQHLTLMRELNSGTWSPGRVSRNAVMLAGLLAVVGVAMSVYLLFLR